MAAIRSAPWQPNWYNVTNHAGENLTTFVDLTKAGAIVGTQGILQSYWIHGNDTSPQNTTWYQCADIKIVDDLTSANSSKPENRNLTSLQVLLKIMLLSCHEEIVTHQLINDSVCKCDTGFIQYEHEAGGDEKLMKRDLTSG
ncbi:hypothetical protein C2G38_2181704 [Gigaspora rosea]|uniref:Uncharacterized protein n=1 Tax=Gigaspora rosea TaxID=44941 RepID=A0A397VHY2_9GLOM|nr:hypothetical protein C2G38_2181704 [Gigaspora rosea]